MSLVLAAKRLQMGDADIHRVTYDNADMAFVLANPNFTDFRRNAERGGFVHMPRKDENPVRPRFRAAHIYEYALLGALSQNMTKERAGRVILRQFIEMIGSFWKTRIRELDLETAQAITYARQVPADEETTGESSVGEPALWLLRDFPQFGFDPPFLDRSPERQANPLVWLLLPDAGVERRKGWPSSDGAPDSDGVAIVREPLTTKELFGALVRAEQQRPGHHEVYAGEPVIPHSCVALNVTSLLTEIDRRMQIRAHARALKGAE